MRGVGGAVASAGATILIASAALAFAILRSYQSLGPVIAIAVGLMMLAALTLVPARAYDHRGRRAYWPMQPRHERRCRSSSSRERAAGLATHHLRPDRRRRAASAARDAGGHNGGTRRCCIAGLFAFQTELRPAREPAGQRRVGAQLRAVAQRLPGRRARPHARLHLAAAGRAGTRSAEARAARRADARHRRTPARPRARPDRAGPLAPARHPSAAQTGAGARFVSADGGTARIDVVLHAEPVRRPNRSTSVPELARTLARDGAASAGLDAGGVLVGGDTAEAADTRTAGDRDSRVVLPLILLAIGVVLAAAAALADRAALPDGDDRVHVLCDARSRGRGLPAGASTTRASGRASRSSCSSS